jgi:hypothetical protein
MKRYSRMEGRKRMWVIRSDKWEVDVENMGKAGEILRLNQSCLIMVSRMWGCSRVMCKLEETLASSSLGRILAKDPINFHRKVLGDA